MNDLNTDEHVQLLHASANQIITHVHNILNETQPAALEQNLTALTLLVHELKEKARKTQMQALEQKQVALKDKLRTLKTHNKELHIELKKWSITDPCKDFRDGTGQLWAYVGDGKYTFADDEKHATLLDFAEIVHAYGYGKNVMNLHQKLGEAGLPTPTTTPRVWDKYSYPKNITQVRDARGTTWKPCYNHNEKAIVWWASSMADQPALPWNDLAYMGVEDDTTQWDRQTSPQGVTKVYDATGQTWSRFTTADGRHTSWSDHNGAVVAWATLVKYHAPLTEILDGEEDA